LINENTTIRCAKKTQTYYTVEEFCNNVNWSAATRRITRGALLHYARFLFPDIKGQEEVLASLSQHVHKKTDPAKDIGNYATFMKGKPPEYCRVVSDCGSFLLSLWRIGSKNCPNSFSTIRISTPYTARMQSGSSTSLWSNHCFRNCPTGTGYNRAISFPKIPENSALSREMMKCFPTVLSTTVKEIHGLHRFMWVAL
jgi:hypothetical protein